VGVVRCSSRILRPGRFGSWNQPEVIDKVTAASRANADGRGATAFGGQIPGQDLGSGPAGNDHEPCAAERGRAVWPLGKCGLWSCTAERAFNLKPTSERHMSGVTARIKGVYKAKDYRGKLDAATAKDLDELFGYVKEAFPDIEEPEITGPHAGLAMVAVNPRLALELTRATMYTAAETSWAKRVDLRELAIQVINLHFKCDFSYLAHLRVAAEAGLRPDQQAALPLWRTVDLYNDEQRLVIEYTNAVVTGDVPAELFSRVVAHFGETQAIEFTSVIGMWSMWCMIINATRPKFDFGAWNPGVTR
jgi:alkylhydroperoxidase family enzyme